VDALGNLLIIFIRKLFAIAKGFLLIKKKGGEEKNLTEESFVAGNEILSTGFGWFLKLDL